MPVQSAKPAIPATDMRCGTVVAPVISDLFVVNRSSAAVQAAPNNPYKYLIPEANGGVDSGDGAEYNPILVENPNGLPFLKLCHRFKGTTPSTALQVLVYGVERHKGRGGGRGPRFPADVSKTSWSSVDEILDFWSAVPLRDPRSGDLLCDFGTTVQIDQTIGDNNDSSDSSSDGTGDDPDPNFKEQWPDAYYYTHGLSVLVLVSQAADAITTGLVLGRLFG